jgi:UDPglucose 6-dehydrogenase
VIHNIFNPDLVLIGESNKTAGDRLAQIFARLLSTKRQTARMNLVNAELAKLAVNSYVTMKITFANLLARLCERLSGGDVDVVTGALGLDSRIGAKYLKGGLGYGGPCFPRDNEAMLCLAHRLDVSFPLAIATDEANREIAGHVADVVASKVPIGASVGILGLSYKPNTPVIEESQGVLIAKILLERGFEVVAYDPIAMEAARNEFGKSIKYAVSAQSCILEADAVLITTPWAEFKRLEYSRLNGSKDPIVIDCWGMLDEEITKSARVVRLGKSPLIESNISRSGENYPVEDVRISELER